MVSPLVLGPVFEIGKSLLDRLFPDAEERAKAEREFMLAMSERDMRAALAQLEVNAREAAHPSPWVSGWRPFIGWCCGLGFLWATIGHPVASWIGASRGWSAPPAIDTETLMLTMFGMLGLGTLRTAEKIKGAAK